MGRARHAGKVRSGGAKRSLVGRGGGQLEADESPAAVGGAVERAVE